MLMASVASCPHLRNKTCLMSKCFPELMLQMEAWPGSRRSTILPTPSLTSAVKLVKKQEDRIFAATRMASSPRPKGRGQSPGEQDQRSDIVEQQVRGGRSVQGSS